MSARPWPPRRAGCAGDCQPGRRQCDSPIDPIDSLLRRADTDPSLPIGQHEPERVPLKLGGLELAILLVLGVAALVLAVHHAAARTQPQPHPRAAQPDRPGCLSIPTPGRARHPTTT